MKSKRLVVWSVVILSATLAMAQKQELAVTVGGNFPLSSGFDTGASFAVGANYARRMFHVPLAALYGELPVVVATHNTQRVVVPSGYSSFFVTPGLKLKLAPEFPISPYFATGLGVAHFRGTSGLVDGESNTRFVWDWAAGGDMKVLPYFSLRGEVRDFHAGRPSFTVASGNQHDLAAQLGLVFRF